MRIDKWLWSVRIFKSRTLASKACSEGRVKVNGIILKPSSPIKEGQVVVLRIKGVYLTFLVIQLLQKRVGAALAAEAYRDLTPADIIERIKNQQFQSSSFYTSAYKSKGRPTKKDRRILDHSAPEFEEE